MSDELTDILDTAIYKEIASQAFYIAGQSRTEDPGAKVLMKELAEEELKHSQWLKNIKEKGLNEHSWHQAELACQQDIDSRRSSVNVVTNSLRLRKAKVEPSWQRRQL